MAASGPPDEPGNPFEGMPLFGDLAKMFASGGPLNWDLARQVAVWTATEGRPEANVEPVGRIRFEELLRVAELQVENRISLPLSGGGRPLSVRVVGRAEWATRALDAHRPLLERLAQGLAPPPAPGEEPDPTAGFLGSLSSMMSPVLLGMQAGFMVGHLATRVFGQYDLPIPRPEADELLVVAANVDAFSSDWSVPIDDVRLWVCLSELVHHAVLSRPHVRRRIDALLGEYVAGFRVDPGAIEAQLGDIDPMNPTSFQEVLGDPGALLGAIQTDDQRDTQRRLDAVVAAVEGYVDHCVDQIATGLIGSQRQVTEAMRRVRVTRGDADRFVFQLLGLQLDQRQYDRGATFVAGVVERAGDEALDRLWQSERELPTPAEVDAPGLWLARIDLPESG